MLSSSGGSRGSSSGESWHGPLQFDYRLCHPPMKKQTWNTGKYTVAVLGFCVWGANRVGIFVWGAKEGLRTPKARNCDCRMQEVPHDYGVWGASSPAGSGRNRRDF